MRIASYKYAATYTSADQPRPHRLVVFRRPQSPVVVRVVPLWSEFQLQISQKKANHSPVSARERSRALVRAGPPPLRRALTSPRLGFCISFAPAPGDPRMYTIVTEDIAPLADLVAEVKRLHALAVLRSRTSHAWLERYPEEPATATSPDALDAGTLARLHSISSAFSVRSASIKPAPPTGASRLSP